MILLGDIMYVMRRWLIPFPLDTLGYAQVRCSMKYEKGGKPGPGRPKGSGRPTFARLVELIQERDPELLKVEIPDVGTLDDPGEIAVVILTRAAARGDVGAAKEILRHAVGSPPQAVEVSTVPETLTAEDLTDRELLTIIKMSESA